MAALLGGRASGLLPMVLGKIIGKGRSMHIPKQGLVIRPSFVTIAKRRRRRRRRKIIRRDRAYMRKIAGFGRRHVMTIVRRRPTIAYARGRGRKR